jgi:DNA-directed RNA polymerase subunit beta
MIRIGAEETYSYRKITQKENQILLRRKIASCNLRDKAGDERCFIKASPSLHGVVLKNYFARAVKDKRKRTQDKDALGTEMEFETNC